MLTSTTSTGTFAEAWQRRKMWMNKFILFTLFKQAVEAMMSMSIYVVSNSFASIFILAIWHTNLMSPLIYIFLLCIPLLEHLCTNASTWLQHIFLVHTKIFSMRMRFLFWIKHFLGWPLRRHTIAHQIILIHRIKHNYKLLTVLCW